jgi:multidrug efflux pump subunit AcrA (membrane-fusion protein)
MTKKTKTIIIISGLAVGVIIAGVIALHVAEKIIQGQGFRRPSTYTVGETALKKQLLEKTVTFRGIAEGDPQVKVYAPEPGRLIGNSVTEGQYVGVNQVLTTIDRAIIGQTYNPALVHSPIAGMVTKLYFVDRGEPISLQQPVAEVADTSALKVVLSVGEEDLSRVKDGMEAELVSTYDEKQKLPARVVSVTPFVDSDTFSGRIIIKAANPGNTLKVGSSVILNIITGRTQAFLVPQSAVQTDAQSSYVFLDVNKTAKRVPVTQGFIKGDMVEITGEVKEGDLVVTDGSFKLFNGAKLMIAGEQEQGTGPARSPGGSAGAKPGGPQKDGQNR